MRGYSWILSVALAVGGWALAEDNQLTEEEKAEGWILLFNGQDLEGWKCNNGKTPTETTIEMETLAPHGCGGYLVVYDRPFANFVLSFEVRTERDIANSGVFFRVGNLVNPIYTGLEMQVFKGGTGLHDFGAIYDLVGPKENASKVGEWNKVVLTADGPLITVDVNSKRVTEMNCDDFTEPGRRPDGSKHKFLRAIKDFPREGYIGFQDHGDRVWFKNIKLKELPATQPKSTDPADES